jgi:hypothetical protein
MKELPSTINKRFHPNIIHPMKMSMLKSNVII